LNLEKSSQRVYVGDADDPISIGLAEKILKILPSNRLARFVKKALWWCLPIPLFIELIYRRYEPTLPIEHSALIHGLIVTVDVLCLAVLLWNLSLWRTPVLRFEKRVHRPHFFIRNKEQLTIIIITMVITLFGQWVFKSLTQSNSPSPPAQKSNR
jgi:hypothetical protein